MYLALCSEGDDHFGCHVAVYCLVAPVGGADYYIVAVSVWVAVFVCVEVGTGNAIVDCIYGSAEAVVNIICIHVLV